MRIHYLAYSLGLVMIYLGILILIPVIFALGYHEYATISSFLITSVISISVGAILRFFARRKDDFKNLNDIKRNEGFFIVVASWLVAAVFSAIPYMLQGLTPINAFFESCSGITTTGATILQSHPYSHDFIFWRSFTQWLGGMGIIVLFIAVLPQFAIAGRQMFFTEAPGPTEDKFTPRIRSTASFLWMVYVGLTFVQIVCLCIAHMPLFDAICNSMSTISAGGFSPHPESTIGYRSNYITWILIVFIFLSGSSFNLQYKAYTKLNPLLFFKNEEFRVYLGIFLGITSLVGLSLIINDHYKLFDAITQGGYQVISIMTSTGSVSCDYTKWNFTTQLLLVLATLTGGCASSAAGGIKIARWMVLYKVMKVELKKILHPSAIINIKINNQIISKDVISQIIIFIMFYFGIFLASAFLIALLENNILLGLSSSIASLGNIGPGFGGTIGGASGNYYNLHCMSKLILSCNMLIGRLELIPFLVLLEKDFYTFKR